MASVAQRHEVSPIMVSAVSQLLLVVYGIGRNQPTVLPTHGAQRIGRQVRGADFSPAFPVTVLAGRVALVLVVMIHVFLGMFVAVATVGQFPTPTVSAGLLCLLRHGFTSHEKSRHGCVRNGSRIFGSLTIPQYL